jgi:hypothetical protein
MSYKVTFDGNDYYVEAHANRGFRGTYNDPPEPPEVVIDEVTDEDGNSVSDEIFDQMEESITKQLEEMVFGY